MDPKQYTGSEWTALLREMTPKQIRAAVKGAYRAEAKKARAIAVRNLSSSGLDVQGNRSDWQKGIRSYIYRNGGGFMITVKARGSKDGGKSMHVNRFGFKKPILMWAEEGTKPRKTKSNGGSHARTFVRRLRKGHATGSMPAYGFLARSAPEMYRTVEQDLYGEVEKAVEKKAAKLGFI